MDPSTNIPYVKKFDKNGVCINPIRGKEHAYINYGENRRERRAYKNEPRFAGNSVGPHMTVLRDTKYVRVVQWIKVKLAKGKLTPFSLKNFKLKPIKHYLPSQVNSVKSINQQKEVKNP